MFCVNCSYVRYLFQVFIDVFCAVLCKTLVLLFSVNSSFVWSCCSIFYIVSVSLSYFIPTAIVSDKCCFLNKMLVCFSSRTDYVPVTSVLYVNRVFQESCLFETPFISTYFNVFFVQ